MTVHYPGFVHEP